MLSVKQGGIKDHFLKSLVWFDLGLKLGLPDNSKTFDPLGQWAGYIYIYIYIYKSWRLWSRTIRRLPFQLLIHRAVGEGVTLCPGLLHFTLDTLLSVKQWGNQEPFFWVFGITRPGIELQSPWPLAGTLPIRPMARIFIYPKWFYKEVCYLKFYLV